MKKKLTYLLVGLLIAVGCLVVLALVQRYKTLNPQIDYETALQHFQVDSPEYAAGKYLLALASKDWETAERTRETTQLFQEYRSSKGYRRSVFSGNAVLRLAIISMDTHTPRPWGEHTVSDFWDSRSMNLYFDIFNKYYNSYYDFEDEDFAIVKIVYVTDNASGEATIYIVLGKNQDGEWKVLLP